MKDISASYEKLSRKGKNKALKALPDFNLSAGFLTLILINEFHE